MTEVSAPRKSPSIEFLDADPAAIRDAAVAFWWARRRWPEWTIDQYYRMWDWRYSSLTDGPPRICIARNRDTGAVVGHHVVYRRRFRYNDTVLAVGVPSSLAVSEDLQGGIAGARLTAYPSRQLRAGEYDVILSFANRIAQDMLLRLGAQDLGQMAAYLDVRKAAPMIRHHVRALAPLAFVADAGFALRRQWLRLRRGRWPKLEAHEVTGAEFLRLDRSHWIPARDRVIPADSSEYVVRRYLECPYAERKLYAILAAGTGSCEGFVVVEGTERVDLWDVQVNCARLELVDAIVAASRAFRGARTITASALPGTVAATALSAAGLFRTGAEKKTTTPRLMNATVRPKHALENELKDISRWSFWTGTSQY